MKRILLLLVALCPLLCMAQTDTTSTAPHEQYCMVVASTKFMSTKVNITVDFGQETKLFSFKDQRLKDQEGKIITFNSVIDALNYMSTQGWLFVNAYVITVSSQNIYHYVMRKPVPAK
jgi:hypothetical protein